MMLEIAAVLEAVRPDLIAGGSTLSVAKIQTTRPLYLVFTESAEYPRYVVQFGDQSPLRRLDEWLSYLYVGLPDLVPQSLACAPWRDDQWVHVQEGLPGLPWFRLAHSVRDVSAWLRLRARALAALRRVQGTVAGNPAWCTVIEPGGELRRQAAIARDHGCVLGESVEARIHERAASLDRIAPLSSSWQHGDYCINNLLVSDERLGLIDFEEFGGTSMPLHDEFSLAFSSHDFMSQLPDGPSLADQVGACIRDRLATTPMSRECVEGLLLHHLLWRRNQAATRPRRGAIGLALHRHLEQVVKNPRLYVEGL